MLSFSHAPLFARARNRALRQREPEHVSVKARRVDFTFDEKLPRYWYQNDPFLSHFMHALSITFPDGERLFMDAVRAVRERVSDPETCGDIAGFMGQEALHSRAHEGLNEFLTARGYPIARLQRQVHDNLAQFKRERGKANALALTCAIEHITAIMGHELLAKPALQAAMHEDMRRLWVWHALEEIEHKAVAFDVYQEVYGHYRLRAVWLLIGTLSLMLTVLRFQATLLEHDGLAHKPSLWIKGIWRLWGPRGLMTPLVPQWLKYLKPDFHPWQQDDSALVAKYGAQF